MKEQDLRQLFRNNSDCYAQVWITGKGHEDEPALSEDKFIELINKIFKPNELKGVSNNELTQKVCSLCEGEKYIYHTGGRYIKCPKCNH